MSLMAFFVNGRHPCLSCSLICMEQFQGGCHLIGVILRSRHGQRSNRCKKLKFVLKIDTSWFSGQ